MLLDSATNRSLDAMQRRNEVSVNADPPEHASDTPSPCPPMPVSSCSSISSLSESQTSLGYHRSHSKQRHISFNTYVEQCIAIEKPRDDNLTSDSLSGA